MYFLYSALLGIGILVSILGLSLFALTAFIYYNRYPLRHIPCPPMANYILGHMGNIAEYVKKDKITGDAAIDWSKTHGHVFRIHFLWVNNVIILKASAIKEILITSDWPKYPWTYSHVHSVYGMRFAGNGLFTELRKDRWTRNRALFNPALHRSYLKTCFDQFNISSNIFLKDLETKCDGKTEVNMLDEFNKVGMDIIAKVGFGIDFGIYNGNSNAFLDNLTVALSACSVSFRRPWDRFSPFARNYRKKIDQSLKFIREAGRQSIEKQIDMLHNGEKLTNNIVAYILQTSSESGADIPSMEEMVDEFVTFFVAGQETTANMQAWTLMLLLHNPEVLYRLRTEVEAVIGDKEDIAFEDLSKLEYMMAVLKESLRLYPPVHSTVREAPEDHYIDDIKIPKGTGVLLSSYSMSRMEENFPNAATFDPDRFLSNKNTGKYASFPFSLGSRVCIGQQFGLIEGRVILSKLLRNFEFTWVEGQSVGKELGATLKPKGGCKCYITRRK